MQRKPLASRWQPFQWAPVEVLLEPGLPAAPPRCLRHEEDDTRWLFTGFELRLYSDEAEGYFLNADSGAPCWFIMTRLEEIDGVEVAVPHSVTLSYNEAARLMDGGEKVDTLPVPPLIAERLVEFVQAWYRPEPKRKRRKPSFEGGAAVAQMAAAEGGAGGR
ncbi:DUF3305 domain-containing protein [Massilia endophytica]|uniref:DUF3305 domain-containing protein n=1 Tax=Massilia endophytica TaxID=2899220 RepID=UPI001E4E2D5B|nr:DUF3305 domain-containing protein [Massilia endophytica]UGQ48103.1 DUF3305 domain-containing protein [Massilia endophytica]